MSENLADRLLGPGDGAGARTGRLALTDDAGARVTYGELARGVATFRSELAADGVAAGATVGLALGNRVDFVVAYLAVLGLGAAAAPLNPDSPPAELEVETERAHCDRVIRDITDGRASGLPARAVEVRGELPAALCQTSGTSGTPAVAILTHRQLGAAIDAIAADARTAIRTTDVVLGVLPLFHIYGLSVILGATLAAGGCVELHDHFDPSRPLDATTVVAAVPPMLAAWARAGTSMPAARAVVSGAAPLPAATAAAFTSATGVPVTQGYGLTEAASVVSSGLLLDDPDPMSVGVPLPGIRVRLVDPAGQTALAGDPGEIEVTGANVFAGYLGHAPQTGPLLTGDVGVVDDRGRLYIVDREKDIVIVSGFNVFPGEVEAVLVDHPGVAHAAVTGVPDDHTGEAVKATVVREAGTDVSPDELTAWVRTRLARYKSPKVVEFADALPVLPAGKVARRRLRSGGRGDR